MLAQDSPSDLVSVNYCQLSSPGYKEEELRVGETTPLGARTQEFVFGKIIYRSRNWFHMTEFTLTPNTTANFDFDGTSLSVKKSGLFLICTSNAYVHISYDGLPSATEHKCKYMTVKNFDENDKITFYSHSNYYTGVENSTLRITAL